MKKGEKIDETNSSAQKEKYKRGCLQVSSLNDVASFVRYIQNMEIIIYLLILFIYFFLKKS